MPRVDFGGWWGSELHFLDRLLPLCQLVGFTAPIAGNVVSSTVAAFGWGGGCLLALSVMVLSGTLVASRLAFAVSLDVSKALAVKALRWAFRAPRWFHHHVEPSDVTDLLDSFALHCHFKKGEVPPLPFLTAFAR